MRIKVVPGDFWVQELANLQLKARGDWAVLRIRKVNITTLRLRQRLAHALGLTPRQVKIPALKDRTAVALQYATVPAEAAKNVEDEDFHAEVIGYRSRRLSVSDLTGNRFQMTVRDLSADQARNMRQRLEQMGHSGLPNYFDQQRFGSWPVEDEHIHIGKRILQRDAEGAMRAYLTEPFVGDPRRVLAFKRQAAERWPDWREVFEVAPKPSNFRSVLTYLIDHPEGYRKALNLIPRRLLSIYLSAYQSHLWNRIVAGYLRQQYAQQGIPYRELSIAEVDLPVHLCLPDSVLQQWRGAQVALPSHRARYRSEGLGQVAQRVLSAEGFEINDLKARILTKAYMTRSGRDLLLAPQRVETREPEPDEHFQGRQALRLRFSLPRGSYASLVLKAAAIGPPKENGQEGLPPQEGNAT